MEEITKWSTVCVQRLFTRYKNSMTKIIQKTGHYYGSLNQSSKNTVRWEHPPSDTMTASPLLAASVLAISLSSPVEPLPHHTYATWGVTTTKQSLELRQPARRSTWRSEEEEETEWVREYVWRGMGEKAMVYEGECEWVCESEGVWEEGVVFINYFTLH